MDFTLEQGLEGLNLILICCVEKRFSLKQKPSSSCIGIKAKLLKTPKTGIF